MHEAAVLLDIFLCPFLPAPEGLIDDPSSTLWPRGPTSQVFGKFELLHSCKLAGGGSHGTANEVTWPEETGSDQEMTSFDRKSPESGCEGL